MALAGCAGTLRPAVSPAVSTLPDEPEQREEHLAAAAARPSLESGPSSAVQADEAETVAATLAAVLGMIFSTSEGAFVGFVVPIEENRQVAPKPVTPQPPGDAQAPPP